MLSGVELFWAVVGIASLANGAGSASAVEPFHTDSLVEQACVDTFT